MEDYQGCAHRCIKIRRKRETIKLSVGKIYYLNTWLLTEGKEQAFVENEYVFLLEIKESEDCCSLKLLTSQRIFDVVVSKTFNFGLFVETTES